MKTVKSILEKILIVEFIVMLAINIIVSYVMHAIAPAAFGFWSVFFIIFCFFIFMKLRKHPETRKLAKACMFVIGGYILILFVSAYLPMAWRTAIWQASNADIALTTDSTKTQQKLVFNEFRDQKVYEVMMSRYKNALAAGDPKLATKIMDSIRRKWDPELISKQLKVEEDSAELAHQVRRDSIEQAIQARRDSIEWINRPAEPEEDDNSGNVSDIANVSEKATLQQGERWSTKNRFHKGDLLTLTVRLAPVMNLHSNGTSEIIPVGTYNRIMISDGVQSFEGLGRPAKISVSY